MKGKGSPSELNGKAFMKGKAYTNTDVFYFFIFLRSNTNELNE